jgi:hypothetical protein
MNNNSHIAQISRLSQHRERKKNITTHELIKRWQQQQEARELLRLFDTTKVPSQGAEPKL